ncbi:hypothetical protein [Vibrio sp. 10N.239.312.D08]|uniref:hypothetical protein n=1 Tax=Vibrio sp. 10N.239.312.D08 TaxID=3229978 RepID=UPI003550E87C
MKLKLKYSTAAILASTILSGCASTQDKAQSSIDNLKTTSEYLLTSKNSDAAHVGTVTTGVKVAGFNDFDRNRSADVLINSDVTIAQSLQLISMMTGRVSIGEGMTHVMGLERNRNDVAPSYLRIELVKFNKVDSLDHKSVKNALVKSRNDLNKAISFAYNRIGVETKTIGTASDLSSNLVVAPFVESSDSIYACHKHEKASEIFDLKVEELNYKNASCALYSFPFYNTWNNDLDYNNILPKGQFTVSTISLPLTFPLSKLADFDDGKDMFVVLPEEPYLRGRKSFQYISTLDDKQRDAFVDPWILKPQSSVYSLEQNTFLEYGYK